MKKLILLIVLFAFGHLQLKAGKDKLMDATNEASINSAASGLSSMSTKDITEGGFFVHFGGVLPSRGYFFPVAIVNDSGYKYGIGGSFEIGNMFRIADLDGMAIGLKATWFSALYTGMKVSVTEKYGTAQASILKIGPYFTVGLSNDQALDVYYQIAPAFAVEVWHGDQYGLGAVHSLGVGYRFSVLSVGMDYNFGNLMDLDMIGETMSISEKDWYKYRTNHLRLFVGVKL